VFLCDFAKKYEDAIAQFRAVVESDVDDKDDTGRLMTPYRNYRFHSWRMTATCFEKLGRWPEAVDASLRSRKAYVSHCGTCLGIATKDVEKSTTEQLAAWLGADTKFEISGFGDKFATGEDFLIELSSAAPRDVAKKMLADALQAWPKSAKLKDALDKLK
jgi:hypothetical protein